MLLCIENFVMARVITVFFSLHYFYMIFKRLVAIVSFLEAWCNYEKARTIRPRIGAVFNCFHFEIKAAPYFIFYILILVDSCRHQF